MIATLASRLQGHPSIIGSLSAHEEPVCEELNDANDLFVGEDMSRIGYLPTPEDIASACAAIRADWTLSEKRRRFVGELMPDEPESVWRPPVIDTSHFRITAGQASTESSF